jgi:tetratricopeptide (TPR) repeat protein
VSTAQSAEIYNSLAHLREVHGSLRLAASGTIPAGSVRAKYVRRVRSAGYAALPSLIRALRSESETEATWAAYLLVRLGGSRVADRLSALVESEDLTPATRARALSLLTDLDVDLPDTRSESAALLEQSVSELVGTLEDPEDLDEAVALVVTQIPEPELPTMAIGLLRHRDARGRALVERLSVQVSLSSETRRALRELLGATADDEVPLRTARARGRQAIDAALDDLEAGRVVRARRTLERLAAQKPDRAEVRSALGVCLLELEEPLLALAHLQAAAEIEPDEPLHQWNVASAMKGADRVGGCYLALRRYLAADDHTEGADQRMAEARRYVRGYERMLRHTHPGVSLSDVLRGEALFASAHAALEEGRPAEAMRGFEAVLALVPRHFPSWANLGAALVALGRRGEALGCLHRALEIEPDYAPAKKNLALLEGRN